MVALGDVLVNGRRGFIGAATLSSRMADDAKPRTRATKSFNGAATLSSRMGQRARSVVVAAVVASMGPRRYRRGWTVVTTIDCGDANGFNGAATLSSRMEFNSLYYPRSWHASMGPRRYRRGWPGRGRRRCLLVVRFNGAATLSSRMEHMILVGKTGSGLQWGRDVIVADGRSGTSRPGSRTSFNGAATLSSRMGDLATAARNDRAVRASMGPRRYRRGWCGAGERRVSDKEKLQWGRDVIVADGRTRPQDLRVGRSDASMGPRRYRRGWATSAAMRSTAPDFCFNGAATLSSRMASSRVYLARRSHASMGPRRYRRGWRQPANVVEVRVTFASMGPRRYRRGWRRHRAQRSRGPGASMGPRRYRRGWWLEAEEAVYHLVFASMGPRRYRRGWEVPRLVAPPCSGLQWGRDVIVADGVTSAKRGRPSRRFNGAATLSSRMGNGEPRLLYHNGTRFNGAATLSSRMVDHARELAQWSGLQWGRDVIVADGIPAPRPSSQASSASMGPRRYRRGWVTTGDGVAVNCRECGASMGPRRYRRGWFGFGCVSDGFPRASMGPRRYRRGWMMRSPCSPGPGS